MCSVSPRSSSISLLCCSRLSCNIWGPHQVCFRESTLPETNLFRTCQGRWLEDKSLPKSGVAMFSGAKMSGTQGGPRHGRNTTPNLSKTPWCQETKCQLPEGFFPRPCWTDTWEEHLNFGIHFSRYFPMKTNISPGKFMVGRCWKMKSPFKMLPFQGTCSFSTEFRLLLVHDIATTKG